MKQVQVERPETSPVHSTCYAAPQPEWWQSTYQRLKQSDNLKFYIPPDECLFCSVCEGEAPNNFKLVGETWQVHKQPDSPKELELVVSAMGICCVNCIYFEGADEEFRKFLRNHPASLPWRSSKEKPE